MESWKWRYHPEFRIQLLVDGQPATGMFDIVGVKSARSAFANYGLIARDYESGIVCHQLQKPDGANWISSVDLTEPACFNFWLMPKAGANFGGLPFFGAADPVFGRPVLYADNLDAAGAIDVGLAGGVVPLTADVSAGDEERGSVSHPVVGTSVAAGAFTQIRAGKIGAGAAVSFTESESIAPTDTAASLDFSGRASGVWRVELTSGAPVSETVVIDPLFARSDALGYIAIYRDAWLTPSQPREYQLNFST